MLRWRRGLARRPRPKELGGGGRTALESIVLNEEMQLARAPIDAMGVTVITAAILMEHGSDHLKETVVPALLNGEALTSFGYTEPESGSDVQRPPPRRSRTATNG